MEKAFWQAICDDHHAVPAGQDVGQLTAELLGYLGSTDPDLRDRFGYFLLGTWIERGLYGASEMIRMADQMIRHLQTGLGERGTDTVYLRSFAALILVELLGRDAVQPYLSAAQFAEHVQASLAWYQAEADLRGYEADKGWSHAGAHGADLLRVIARHPATDAPGLHAVLTQVAAKVTGTHGQVFLCDEDERLASAVLVVLDRQLLTLDEFTTWAATIAQQAEPWRSGSLAPAQLAARQNTRNFLRSLYLRLQEPEQPPAWTEGALFAVRGSLQAIRRWA